MCGRASAVERLVAKTIGSTRVNHQRIYTDPRARGERTWTRVRLFTVTSYAEYSCLDATCLNVSEYAPVQRHQTTMHRTCGAYEHIDSCSATYDT
jgi:hypothetical protein